jgi:hypothetical protein
MGFTETLEVLINSSANNAGFEQSTAAALGLGGPLKSVKSLMAELGSGSAASGALVAGGVVVAGAAITKFAIDAVGDFARVAGQVTNFQRVTGDTAQVSSQMVYTMNELGINADAGGTAFGRFAQRVGQGKIDLSSWGVEAARAKNGTIDVAGTVENLAAKFSQIQDPTQRAALGMTAFGRGWQTLAPLLDQGKSGLKAFFDEAQRTGHVFTQDQLDQARAYVLSVKELGASFEGLKMTAGEAMAPLLTEISTELAHTVENVQAATQGIGGLGGVIKGLGDAAVGISPLGSILSTVNAGADLLQGHFAAASGEALKSVPIFGSGLANALGIGGDATTKMAQDQSNLQGALAAVKQGVTSGQTGTVGYAAALKQASVDSKIVAGDQSTLSNTLQTVTMSASDAAAALDSMGLKTLTVAESGLKVAAANYAEGIAQITYNDAVQKYGVNSAQAGDAQIKLATAQFAVVSAAQTQDQIFNELKSNIDAGKASVSDEIAKLKDLEAANPSLAASFDPVIFRLLGLQQQLDNTGNKKPKPTVDLEVSGFNAKHSLVRSALDILNGSFVQPKVGLDTSIFDSAISNVAQRLANVTAGFGSAPSKAPKHAAGGVFTQPHIGWVADAGAEAVIPLSNPSRAAEVMQQAGLTGGGGGGTQISVSVAGSVMSERDLVDVIHEGLLAKARRGGSLQLT